MDDDRKQVVADLGAEQGQFRGATVRGVLSLRLSLPIELVDWIDRGAERRGMTRSSMIRALLYALMHDAGD